MILADRRTWATIREALACNDRYISRWSKRFEAKRLGVCLYSRHCGQPVVTHTLTPCLEARILEAIRKPPDDGTTDWSTRKLGINLEVSRMMVARVSNKHGMKPHRLQRYIASNNLDFESKAADILGLYPNPPAHSAVFGVDEKTAVQALRANLRPNSSLSFLSVTFRALFEEIDDRFQRNTDRSTP